MLADRQHQREALPAGGGVIAGQGVGRPLGPGQGVGQAPPRILQRPLPVRVAAAGADVRERDDRGALGRRRVGAAGTAIVRRGGAGRIAEQPEIAGIRVDKSGISGLIVP